MKRRQRILGFGAMAVLVAGGIACFAAARGVTAEAVGFAMMLLGSLGLVMLVFLEVGLSEEHDRARAEARRAQRAAAAASRHPPRRLRPSRRPRRPS